MLLHVPPSDLVRRFIFENRPVRGHWVRLEETWRALRAHSDYPPAVAGLLGEGVAASVLLAATLKFRGTLTLQLQGDGAVGLLVAQCAHDFRLRALARFDAAALQAASAECGGGASFRGLVGSGGRVTVTIEAEEAGTRYQGVVPLVGSSLSGSLEAYFASSEQLPTRVLLAADERFGAGVLLQRLPGSELDPDEVAAVWDDAQRGIERLTSAQLLHARAEELLAQGFADHELRLFRGAPVQFQCRCSAARVVGLLRALGAEEIRDVLREQGSVTVTCEFCSRPYRFDSVDVEALFSDRMTLNSSIEIH